MNIMQHTHAHVSHNIGRSRTKALGIYSHTVRGKLSRRSSVNFFTRLPPTSSDVTKYFGNTCCRCLNKNRCFPILTSYVYLLLRLISTKSLSKRTVDTQNYVFPVIATTILYDHIDVKRHYFITSSIRGSVVYR